MKKFISTLLVLAMIFSMSGVVFAEDAKGANTATTIDIESMFKLEYFTIVNGKPNAAINYLGDTNLDLAKWTELEFILYRAGTKVGHYVYNNKVSPGQLMLDAKGNAISCAFTGDRYWNDIVKFDENMTGVKLDIKITFDGKDYSIKQSEVSSGNETIVKAGKEVEYRVDIPSSINFGELGKGTGFVEKNYSIRVLDSFLEPNHNVYVTAPATGTIKNSLSNDTLTFTNTLTEFVTAEPAKEDGTLSINKSDVKYAGIYAGTLTFNIEYK